MAYLNTRHYFSFLVILACFCVLNCQKRRENAPPSSSQSDDNTEPATVIPELHARQLWLKMDKDLKTAVGKIVKKVLPFLIKEIYQKDISAKCLSSLLQLASALKASKLWAYQLLDSSGRFPEGFLSGTVTSLGNYEECVNLNVNETKFKMRGQYCTLNLIPPVPAWKPFTSVHLTVPELFNISAPDTVISYLGGFLHNLHVTTIKVGLCTPSLCTTEDINKLVQIIPEKLSIPWKFDVSRCEIREPVNFTTSQFISLYVIGILAALIITGTIVSYVWSSEEMERSNSVRSTLFNAVKAFSFTSNAKKLSDYTCPEENLSFVYGIIFIVFYWVVISNTFMYVNYDVASNFIEALRIVKHLFYELALNRIIPLQSLFFVSGLLTTYRYLKTPEKNLNIFKFIFKRYWRYTPAYGLILALIILTPTWGSGPSWYSHLNPVYTKCRDNWWYNLLYINNFIDTGRVCLDHTWVIAVDAQLHVIAIFILIPLKLRPKIGLLITFVLALASLTSVALTNVYYDLPPNEMSAFLHPRDRMFYAEHTYYRVYTHLGIYCTGVFVGYFMVKYPNIKISKKMSTFLWLMTTVALVTALTCVHEWRNGAVPSPLLGAIYTTFSKIAEASFLAWVAVACMTGHSDGVRDVLSWRPFHFLSRLAFIAYIMHVPIINMIMGFRKAHIFISELEIFHVVLSHAAATYVITYILYICFEAPWLALADVVRKRCKARTFTSTSETMTEKPVKYLDKDKNVTSSSIKIWTSALEKGHL